MFALSRGAVAASATSNIKHPLESGCKDPQGRCFLCTLAAFLARSYHDVANDQSTLHASATTKLSEDSKCRTDANPPYRWASAVPAGGTADVWRHDLRTETTREAQAAYGTSSNRIKDGLRETIRTSAIPSSCAIVGACTTKSSSV